MKRERPAFLKEIGSATISLRSAAVLDFSDDEDDGMVGGNGGAKGGIVGVQSGTSKGNTSGGKQTDQPTRPTSHGFGSYSLNLPQHSDSTSRPSRTPSPGTDRPPGITRLNSGIRAPLPTIISPLFSPLPTSSAKPTSSRASSSYNKPFPPISSASSRRPRANSVHVPSGRPVVGAPGSYFLPHFSTDRAYSLQDNGSAIEGESTGGASGSGSQINLELGLGGAFDASFGEALRRGAGGDELPLPREALRVLTEAKDSLETRLLGKQGRKGSMGMGLFKESRKASLAGLIGAGGLQGSKGKLETGGGGDWESVKERKGRDRGYTAPSAPAQTGRREKASPGVSPQLSPAKETYSALSTIPTPRRRILLRDTVPEPLSPTRHSSSAVDTLPGMVEEDQASDLPQTPTDDITAAIQILPTSPILRRPSTRVKRPVPIPTGPEPPVSGSDSAMELPAPPLESISTDNEIISGSYTVSRSGRQSFSEALSMSDESGWTSGTGSSSSGSESGSGTDDDGEDVEESASQEGGQSDTGYFGQGGEQGDAGLSEDTELSAEEEDHMTVPLQPFNHAVGGHSSIYKFTRRAVCKVSLSAGSCDIR